MAKRNATAKAAQRGIQVDIPHVKPNTTIAELTVAQYVELLVQVSEQLAAARVPDPKITKQAIEQIRKLAAKGVDNISNEVIDIQQAILKSSTKGSAGSK